MYLMDANSWEHYMRKNVRGVNQSNVCGTKSEIQQITLIVQIKYFLHNNSLCVISFSDDFLFQI